MRPKRERVTDNQQTYMVTSTTWGRRSLFRPERWAKLFLDTLYHYRGSAYLLHEFVVMPDHFHAIITPQASLEKAVQFIKGGFSYRAKKELGSNMEVWQKGFSDHRIRDASDYQVHVAYVHQNPVKERLCTGPEEYPYSSAYPGFELDPVPQRLKPLGQMVAGGAAEAAPFQGAGPQRLKPLAEAASNGEPEGPPFQGISEAKANGAPKGATFQITKAAGGQS
ncbi:MAG: transposase [Acidobacteria bacterium]|nr:transposase [Acidobacteriota bacterium]